MDSLLEDPFSQFSVEDDGSLLVLSRIFKDEPLQIPINNASSSRDDEGSDGEGIEDDLCLQEIEQILKKEQESLEMVREANEEMKKLISSSTEAKASVLTSQVQQDGIVNEFEGEDVNLPNESPTVAVKPYQKLFGRLSSNFRRRRPFTRLNRGGNNPVNMQTFIQDYYQSLNSVSRYIIFASILSFVTAFILLSCYSAQTHSHDMEMFKLKENRVLSDQKMFEEYQLKNENFRESLIHQRYEESRECQSSLQSCSSKRDELVAQISKMDSDTGKLQTKLEADLESHQKEIQSLKVKIQDLQRQNQQLRQENGQQVSSSFLQILLNLLNIIKNKSVQVFFGTLSTTVVLLGITCFALRK